MNLHSLWINVKQRVKQPLFLAAGILACGLFTLGAFLCLNEWQMVYIRHKTHNYVWGLANNNPWYYETPQLYGWVMLIEGSIMLCLVGLTIYLICKKRRMAVICLLPAGLLMIYLLVYNNQIV